MTKGSAKKIHSTVELTITRRKREYFMACTIDGERVMPERAISRTKARQIYEAHQGKYPTTGTTDFASQMATWEWRVRIEVDFSAMPQMMMADLL